MTEKKQKRTQEQIVADMKADLEKRARRLARARDPRVELRVGRHRGLEDMTTPSPKPTCPTCRRRPSERTDYVEIHDGNTGEFKYVKDKRCSDPIHDLADRLVAEHATPRAREAAERGEVVPAECNAERRSRARAALAAYREALGDGLHDEADLRDLISDLLHLAQYEHAQGRAEYPAEQSAEVALRHYITERREEAIES